MKKPLLILLIILIYSALLLNGCAKNPVTHENQFVVINEEDEVKIGQEADIIIKEKFGVYNSPALLAYVDRVGQKVAAVCDRQNISYHFTILDTNMVNAFALPGGYVYITRGLLARLNSEAELANILGHEITHITARHAVQRLSQVYGYELAWIGAGILLNQPDIYNWKELSNAGVQIALLGYSRENEFEADRVGSKYAFLASYDPQGMASFLTTLQHEEKDSSEYVSWLQTHPPTKERIAKANQKAKKLKNTTDYTDLKKNLIVLPDFYKEKIDGLELGPGKKSGEINGRQYKNKYYGCRIVAPKEWKLSRNKSQALIVFKEKNKKYTVYLQAVKLTQPIEINAWIKKVEAGLGNKVRKVKGFPNKDALKSYSAFYEEEVKTLGKIIERRDFITKSNYAYVITYLAREKDYMQGTKFFDEIFNSFEFLSAEEIQRSFSQYLIVYTAEKGDTPKSITKEKLGSFKKENKLIEFNGLDPDIELYTGQKLKLPPRESE